MVVQPCYTYTDLLEALHTFAQASKGRQGYWPAGPIVVSWPARAYRNLASMAHLHMGCLAYSNFVWLHLHKDGITALNGFSICEQSLQAGAQGWC